MLTRIAFIAPHGQSQQRLRAALSRPLSYSVREFTSLADVQSNLARFPFDVLLMRLPTFEAAHTHTVERLSQVFPAAGLITVSPRIDFQARFLIRNLKRHLLVDETLELGDLDRLIARSSNPQDRSMPRMHPRTKRQDEAVLVTTDERYDEDFFHDARFVDFARMGARVQVSLRTAEEMKLQAKSRVELRYRSTTDGSKVHRLEARVVWVKKANPLEQVIAGSRVTIGLRFVAEL